MHAFTVQWTVEPCIHCSLNSEAWSLSRNVQEAAPSCFLFFCVSNAIIHGPISIYLLTKQLVKFDRRKRGRHHIDKRVLRVCVNAQLNRWRWRFANMPSISFPRAFSSLDKDGLRDVWARLRSLVGFGHAFHDETQIRNHPVTSLERPAGPAPKLHHMLLPGCVPLICSPLRIIIIITW